MITVSKAAQQRLQWLVLIDDDVRLMSWKKLGSCGTLVSAGVP